MKLDFNLYRETLSSIVVLKTKKTTDSSPIPKPVLATKPLDWGSELTESNINSGNQTFASRARSTQRQGAKRPSLSSPKNLTRRPRATIDLQKIKSGDLVVVNSNGAPIKRGRVTLAQVPGATQLVVLRVEKSWVGVSYNQIGQNFADWIHKDRFRIE